MTLQASTVRFNDTMESISRPDDYEFNGTSQETPRDVWTLVNSKDDVTRGMFTVQKQPTISTILSPINHALDSRDPVIVKSGILLLISIVNVIGNSIALTAFRKTPRLRTKTFTLLFSLTVADLIIGLEIFFYIPYQLLVYVFSASPCDNIILVAVLSAPQRYPLVVTMSYVGLISVERFIAISYPLQYEAWITDRTMRVATAVGWILPAVLSSTFFLFIGILQALFFDVTYMLFIMTVTIVLYSRIMMIALHQRARINAEVSSWLMCACIDLMQ
jgi:7 transmembrane receptor (rhodopsin family)